MKKPAKKKKKTKELYLKLSASDAGKIADLIGNLNDLVTGVKGVPETVVVASMMVKITVLGSHQPATAGTGDWNPGGERTERERQKMKTEKDEDLNVHIHNPGNTKPIEVLHAWLSRDQNGNEGIIGTGIADDKGNVKMMPLVWSDRDEAIPDFVIDNCKKVSQRLGMVLVKASFARVS